MEIQHQGEVIERLARIEEKIDSYKISLDAHIAADEKIFHGNGRPGLLIEHDRLVSSYRMWKWLFGSAIGAFFLAAFDAITRYLHF